MTLRRRDWFGRPVVASALGLNSPELLDRPVTAKPRVAELLTAPSALDREWACIACDVERGAAAVG